jgi:hypothetical protein
MPRAALLLLNPGRTRRIRLGRGQAFTVAIDQKTRRILSRAGRGAKIPKYWIGVPWLNVRALERALRQAERDRRDCKDATRCREEVPDRRGRRRPCKQTFRGKREAYEALDDAIGGMLSRYMDRADDGAPELLDLARHTGRGRRRRRLPSWGAALDWLAPSSRRWRDFDPQRVRLVSDALVAALERDGSSAMDLRLPRQTERLLDAELEQGRCDDIAGDRIAAAMAAALADLVGDVPF